MTPVRETAKSALRGCGRQYTKALTRERDKEDDDSAQEVQEVVSLIDDITGQDLDDVNAIGDDKVFGSRPVVIVKINGKEIKTLLDSGSVVVLMSEEVVKICGLHKHRFKGKLKSAFDRLVPIKGVVYLRYVFDGHERAVRALVASKTSCPLILGSDFFGDNGLILDHGLGKVFYRSAEDRILELSQCETAMNFQEIDEKKWKRMSSQTANTERVNTIDNQSDVNESPEAVSSEVAYVEVEEEISEELVASVEGLSNPESDTEDSHNGVVNQNLAENAQQIESQSQVQGVSDSQGVDTNNSSVRRSVRVRRPPIKLIAYQR